MAITPTRQTLERELKNLIATLTGIAPQKVISGNTNAPAPQGLYCTVLLTNSAQLGIDNRRYEIDPNDNTQCIYTIKGRRENTYSVQFYRGNNNEAYDTAELFRHGVHGPRGQNIISASSFSWSQSGDIIVIDEIVSGKYERRVSMDVTIKYLETSTEIVNNINEVNVSVTNSAETDVTGSVNVNQ